MDSIKNENRIIPSFLVSFDGMGLPPFSPFVKDAKSRFESIRNLETRRDDVILATYPKSGTHWVWEIVNMLLQGKAEYTISDKKSRFLEAVPDLSSLNNLTSPRNLNTHLPYRWLPKQHLKSGGKIVHVIRNPKDMVVSMYYHIKASGEFGNKTEIPFEDVYKMYFFSPTKEMGGWFEYEKEFEIAEDNDRRDTICTLHFESLKKNPVKEITRLAEFLKVDFTERLITDIADKCSFQNLKKANNTIKKHESLEANLKDQLEDNNANINYKNLNKNMYRKGEIGDWKNHFTVALNEQFDELYKEEMKTSKLQIQFE